MRILKITSEYRNDFSADLECEHCRHVMHITSGYHDNFYHTKVIPGLHCPQCGKNRAGNLSHICKGET